MKFRVLRPVTAKTKNISEAMIENEISQDPSILGLGNVTVIGRQIHHGQGKGFLDLLLANDNNESERFSVELQLGDADPSHIIRTIEYWDNEQARSREHDVTAVLIAENITNRFYNVVRILHERVPLIAIRMSVLDLEEGEFGLVFTRVLDKRIQPKEIEQQPPTDENYWKTRAKTFTNTNALLTEFCQEFPELEPNYVTTYISTKVSGATRNFLIFKPQQKQINLEVILPESSEIIGKLADAFVLQGQDEIGSGQYRFKYIIKDEEFHTHKSLVLQTARESYENWKNQ